MVRMTDSLHNHGRLPRPVGFGWLIGCVLLVAFAFTPAGAGTARKPVFAHYMPWFVARPHSSHWGHHWTMDSCDPDHLLAGGKRQIAAHTYPAIGPYDSSDPVVLEYHVLLMKLAGIDGVIIDWYGCDDVHDYAINERRTRAIRDATGKAGLQFCLCYEDRTIQAAIDTGFIAPETAAIQGQRALLYAQSNYFNDAGYFRLENGKPVLLNFGPQYFRSADQWAEVFSVLDPSNQPALFTLNSRLSAGEGAFNWPPMHLSELTGGVLQPQALADYLDHFERAATRWPAFISSAFPRFHDFYEQAGLHSSYGYLDDDGGTTFRSTLARAMTNDSVMVQLVTWNDFGEGTAIEPTDEFGHRDLAVIQELRREWIDPGFEFRKGDLQLATRFYHVRRELAADSEGFAALDQVFAAIVEGDLQLAEAQLSGIEARLQARDEEQSASPQPSEESVAGLAAAWVDHGSRDTNGVRRAMSTADGRPGASRVDSGAPP
jgi:hypothetical protein